MKACRRLSSANGEVDGLDPLLPETAQFTFDRTVEREAAESSRATPGAGRSVSADVAAAATRTPKPAAAGQSDRQRLLSRHGVD